MLFFSVLYCVVAGVAVIACIVSLISLCCMLSNVFVLVVGVSCDVMCYCFVVVYGVWLRFIVVLLLMLLACPLCVCLWCDNWVVLVE